MSDIWGFLLQTLTASGVAVLLLAVKWMFRDKLSPRWQFAAWGVLALLLLLPAGRGGRYTLLNWPVLVETLRFWLIGDFGTVTRVSAPVPLLPGRFPTTLWDWLFVVYLIGVAFLLARYGLSYLRLRLALKRGIPAGEEQVRRVAGQYGLPVCRSVKVEGLSSAFVCGLWRPVLVLPAGRETDDKVILHELLHYKHKDVLWGLLIGFFRCLHWCDPLLWYCADLAGNDLEALCDQRVLERLDGEDRRDYGRILLGMANEKYARAPGTSSAANGGRNIKARIETIARFKRYPQGMALVSVCVLLTLAVPLAVGARAEAETLPTGHGTGNPAVDFARARAVPCTTVGGALDAYAKAVLAGRYEYRVMCAPLAELNALAADYREASGRHLLNWWPDPWLDGRIYTQKGYRIYNLTQVGPEAYRGLLVLQVNETRHGEYWDSTAAKCPLALQTLRVEKEGDRWVVIPQEDFRYTIGDQRVYGNLSAPMAIYTAQAEDFEIQVLWQNTARVMGPDPRNAEVAVYFGLVVDTKLTPVPDGELTTTYMHHSRAVYTGAPEDKGRYTTLAISGAALWEGDPRPDLQTPGSGQVGGGSSNRATFWSSSVLEAGWEPDHIDLMGGGSEDQGILELPTAIAVDLWLNGEKAAELTLLPTEGGLDHG